MKPVKFCEKDVIGLPTSINVRVTEEEKGMAGKLADYLFKVGRIEKATLSDAMRASLHFTVSEILEAIGIERCGE